MKSLPKVILVLLCLLSGHIIIAQNSKFTLFADSLFQYLNKTEITTNILYDRAFPLSELHGYNSAVDTVTTDFLEQSYLEIYNAAFSRSSLINPDDLSYIQEVENFQNRVPVGVFDYSFNWIDTLAIQHNLISQTNGMFYDVPGRTQSPYILKRAQMAAPMYENLSAGDITFSLPSYFILSNSGLTVQSVQLSFPGVGTAILLPNTQASLSFYQAGDFTGLITVSYTNGTSFTNIFLLTITGSSGSSSRIMGAIEPCYKKIIKSEVAFQGYEETQGYIGQNELNFYYRLNDPSLNCNNSEQMLKKPIILIDGFDPTDKRDATDIYNNLLNYKDALSNTINFARQLRLDGYDVIIVNIPKYIEGTRTLFGWLTVPRIVRGGGDYIERNAMVLVEIIKYVKSRTIDPIQEKVVIVGPSMGGQISRYALRWMEMNGQDHNCKLWISMDSPHLGAVLPIGEQNLVAQLADVSKEAKKSLNRQINIPAARQQLIHHHTANSETPVGSPGFHTRYYDKLNGVGWDAIGKGWPQNLKKVAVTSGAHNGLQQAPGASCADALKIKVRLRRWVTLLLPFTSGNKLQAWIKFSPDQAAGRCIVSNFGFYSFWGDITWPTFGTHSGPYNKSIDLLPAGWYPGFKELSDNLKSKTFIKMESDLYVENHAHIPTASALAYGKGPTPNLNRKWDDDVTQASLNLVCAGEIPFDAYQGPYNFNMRHDELFEAQAQFLMNEITGATNPIFDVIQGPTRICNTAVYKVPNLPPNAFVTWEIPQSAASTLQLSPNTPNTNELTITNLKTSAVNITLTARISNVPGCSATFGKDIYNDNDNSSTQTGNFYQASCLFYNVSHPSQSGNLTGAPIFLHQGCMTYINLYNVYGRTVSLASGSGQPLYWGYTPPTSSSGTGQLLLQLPLGSGGIPFTFNINNPEACYQKSVLFFSYSNNGRYAFVAVPNPAKDMLIVTANEDAEYLAEKGMASAKADLQFTMNIYDMNTQVLVMTAKSNKGSLQHKLNISRLKSGYYALKITAGEQVETIKFLKE
ncbi:MAG: T9SS type A sorting domain-containing protein [Chitinophagaceae bacterium]|nr:T9SS type A sorting domain-containing protein [Chitinophagaceae bacterium]